MKKIETLINKLHEVADFVDRTGMSEDIELIGECIDLACDIKDGKESDDIQLPQDVIETLNIECALILRSNGLNNINGSYCDYEVIEELDNGWHIAFKFGVQDEEGSSTNEFTTYLRKDTMKFSDDEDDVMFEPEDD